MPLRRPSIRERSPGTDGAQRYAQRQRDCSAGSSFVRSRRHPSRRISIRTPSVQRGVDLQDRCGKKLGRGGAPPPQSRRSASRRGRSRRICTTRTICTGVVVESRRAGSGTVSATRSGSASAHMGGRFQDLDWRRPDVLPVQPRRSGDAQPPYCRDQSRVTRDAVPAAPAGVKTAGRLTFSCALSRRALRSFRGGLLPLSGNRCAHPRPGLLRATGRIPPPPPRRP